jgi:hypothetical protein
MPEIIVPELTSREIALKVAIQELKEEEQRELAEAIDKPNCDVVWFDRSEVVDAAWRWVEENVHRAGEGTPDTRINNVRRALKRFMKQRGLKRFGKQRGKTAK